jgi:hypothetical protein
MSEKIELFKQINWFLFIYDKHKLALNLVHFRVCLFYSVMKIWVSEHYNLHSKTKNFVNIYFRLKCNFLSYPTSLLLHVSAVHQVDDFITKLFHCILKLHIACERDVDC